MSVGYDWTPIVLSLQLASLTTAVLLALGVPLAYWLAYSRFPLRFVAEALLNTPLVLPPSVLGFYLLMAFSPESPLGQWLQHSFGLQLVFSFWGLVVGSVIFSLPFMVQPIQAALQGLSPSLREAAYTLGKSRLKTAWHVLLPSIKPAILTGAVLSFAHTIGEFGLVLMIGGNLPGQTKVASIAIYDEVEALNYGAAHFYALVLLSLCLGLLLLVYGVNHYRQNVARR